MTHILIEEHFGMETVIITEDCEVLQLELSERSLWFALNMNLNRYNEYSQFGCMSLLKRLHYHT